MIIIIMYDCDDCDINIYTNNIAYIRKNCTYIYINITHMNILLSVEC